MSPPPVRTRADWLGRAAALVLGIVTVLSVVRAFGPLTYPGDLWRQSDTASMARNYAEHGPHLFLPQINWGGNGPGYVESELPIMPWLTGILYTLFGEHEVLGRLVSLAFMLLATWAFWGLAKRILPPAAARWALIAWAVSPAFMRWGTAFMPEATVLAFTMLALLAFCRWLQEDRPVWLVATAAAVAMAGLAKPTSLHVGLVMGVWLLLSARDRLRRPSLYLAGLAALVLPVLWLRYAAGLHETYGNTFGVLSGGDSKFATLDMLLSPDLYLGNLRTEVIFLYGVVGVPFALLGVAWLWRLRRGAVAAPFLLAGALGLLVYYLALGRYTGSDLGIQYHVYSMPYAAAAVGIGVVAAQRLLRRRVGGALLGLLGVLTVMALGAQSVNVFRQSLTDDAGVLGTCATQLAAVSAPDDLVVVGTDSTTTMDGVSNNFQEPVVLYRADRYGWVLAADRYLPEALASDEVRGARWFVNPVPGQLPAGSPLATWLADNGQQVRTAQADGCDVWRLLPS
ncbi:glycosyltransferase family 39 protein [Pseudonocardia pini]|uniref:glycosyltransferase family 39 protein n=1 Tax=Pseudonocardia pini TaxID=2758030 RepID=UPI0015F09A2D|nr:glycosyltransferase family 39 protein [Pseudonocardia pini]